MRRCKVWACIATAVRSIIVLLAAQTTAAKFVLIPTLARFEESCFFLPASFGERWTINISAAYPDTAPARTCRANVVVHLPARSKAVAFVCTADCIDHFAPHDVAKIGEAVERL